MKKHFFLCLSLVLGLLTTSQAQFSVGSLVGTGYLWERRENLGQFLLNGVDAAQAPILAGVYGQFVTKGKKGMLVGLQLRYQTQRQSQIFAIPTGNPTAPVEFSEPSYNHYTYVVAMPYVGIRLFNRLDLAAGPEMSMLLNSRLVSFNRDPVKTIVGYNLKATYWFGRLGIEGGYSRQTTAFDSEPATRFYNRYAYGTIKYSLLGRVR